MAQMTTSCEFNSETCFSNCANYTMCSLLNTEKHLNSLETKIINIFNSLNSLIEFSVDSGNEIKFIKENIPLKDDILEEFQCVYNEIDKLRELILGGNKELKKLLLEYAKKIEQLSERMERVEKLGVKE